MASIDHQLNSALREFLGPDAAEFSADTPLKDLSGWDSIAHVNLVKALESEFDIRFTVRDMVKMTTIDEIKRIIESRLSHSGR
jgi:acyl carrier protein